jgi:hypothetical protein
MSAAFLSLLYVMLSLYRLFMADASASQRTDGRRTLELLIIAIWSDMFDGGFSRACSSFLFL